RPVPAPSPSPAPAPVRARARRSTSAPGPRRKSRIEPGTLRVVEPRDLGRAQGGEADPVTGRRRAPLRGGRSTRVRVHGTDASVTVWGQTRWQLVSQRLRPRKRVRGSRTRLVVDHRHLLHTTSPFCAQAQERPTRTGSESRTRAGAVYPPVP